MRLSEQWTISTGSVTFTALFVPRRLDKYIRDSTSLSVVEIRNACREGRIAVRIAGTAAFTTAAADWLVFESDVTTLDGKVVIPRKEHQYLVLNKPRHVTTTARDPQGRADLSAWLRHMPNGVFPVGRLDRETSGVLIFTDDGDFSNAILQPDHHTHKLYWLWIDERVADDDPRLLALVSGVRIDERSELLRAVSANVQHRTSDFTELHVTLDEGKNRHIRKMCNILGFRLFQLHRKAIGSIHIDDLHVGRWRALTPHEVEQLWFSCGGKGRVIRNKIAALARMTQSSRETNMSSQRLSNWLKEVSTDREYT